jgi:hypothetical protein
MRLYVVYKYDSECVSVCPSPKAFQPTDIFMTLDMDIQSILTDEDSHHEITLIQTFIMKHIPSTWPNI